jgi:hypothetical protein
MKGKAQSIFHPKKRKGKKKTNGEANKGEAWV